MITERHEELAALHALGLLEGAERTTFERDLAEDPELRSLSVSLVETAALLALAAPAVTPPGALRAALIDQADRPGSAASHPGRVVPLARWLPLAAAAGFAVTTLWLASRNLQLQREISEQRLQRELAGIAVETAQARLQERTILAETLINDLGRQLGAQRDLSQLKLTALAALAGNTPEARAIAVWDPGQKTGLLSVEKLPVIAEGQDYQIWVVDPAYPDPVDGGVFKPGADGRAVVTFRGHQPVKNATAFAVSLEKKGGVPKAEGPIVLLGKL